MNRLVALLPPFLLAMPLFGAGKKWTDAQNLGFAGPVESVTTTEQTFMQQPPQPGGPTTPQRQELALRASGGGTGIYTQNEAHFRLFHGELRHRIVLGFDKCGGTLSNSGSAYSS
jgi:hypothetical protein